MKLHLPTRLRSAVLACITAVAAVASTVGTGVMTTGAVAYTLSATVASAADPVIGTNVTLGDSSAFEPDNSTPYAYDHLTVGSAGISKTIVAGGMFTLYANRLDGSGNITLNRTHNGGNLTAIWLDGDCSSYNGTISLAAGTSSARNIYLGLGGNGGASAPVTVGGTVELNWIVVGLQQDATIANLTMNKTQVAAWNLDTLPIVVSPASGSTGKTAWENFTSVPSSTDVTRVLTVTTGLSLTDTDIQQGITLRNQATGAGLKGGTIAGKLENLAGGSLTLDGTLKLSEAIDNKGTLTFGDDIKFDLSAMTPASEGVYAIITGTVSEGFTALGNANILNPEAGYAYQFMDDGTVHAVLSVSELVWNGGNGTWNDSAENWLNGSAAAHFSNEDKVTFNTEGAVVTLEGDKTSLGVTIDADTTWTGNATVSTTVIGGEGTLSLTNGATLLVTESAGNIKLGGDGSFVLPVGSLALGATLTDTWEGTVAVNRDSNTVLAVTDFNFNAYGREGSTVEVTGLRGYLPKGTIVIAPNLVLKNTPNGSSAAFEINNGYNGSAYTFNGSISGTGNFVAGNCGNGWNTYTFNGDLSGWTGRFQHSGGNRHLIFGGDATAMNGEFRMTGGSADISNTNGLTIKELSVNGGTLTVLADTNVTKLYQAGAGTLNIGTESDQAVVTAGRLESGDAGSGNPANITVAAGSVLKVTGSDSSSNAYKTTGVVLGEWGIGTALTVNGTLLAADATLQPGDFGYSMTVGEGAVVAAKGIGNPTTAKAAKDQDITVNVNGGSLILGSTGITSTHDVTTTLNGNATLGVLGSETAINKEIILAADAALTVNTTSQSVAGNSVTEGSTGGSIVLNSAIVAAEGQSASGTVSITGNGKLVANTAAALGTGAVTVTAGSTLDLLVGNGLAAGQAVTNAGTVILHDTVTQGNITNNGDIVIASGFAGLEGAGIVGIEGVSAAGNGFTAGGTATVFTPATASITGDMTATFAGSTVTIQADGTVTLGDDWGTYHINNTPTETETFGAISSAASAHSATLEGIEIVPENTTLKVDADGLATSMISGAGAETVTLAMQTGTTVTVDTTTIPTVTAADDAEITLHLKESVSTQLNKITGAATLNITGDDTSKTLSFNNGNINRVLNITDATVVAGNSGGTGFNTKATNINAGGVLRLAGGDSLGWGGNAAGLITLTGTEEKVATLELGARQTLKTDLAMNGNTLITAITEGDHSTPMIDPYGGKLTVTGTNNTINTGVRQRSTWEIDVQEDATLVFDSTVLSLETTEGDAGITKKGAGTMTFRDASGTLRNFTADAGETVLENTVFTVGSNLDLSHGDAAAGTVKLTDSSALNFANGVNLWMNAQTKILVDETSAVNLTRDDYSLTVKAAAEDKSAEIAGTRNDYYRLDDDAIQFSNAEVTVTASEAKTLASKLIDSAIVNAGSGTLTLSHEGNTSLTSVHAKGGDITLSAAAGIGSLTIDDAKTVTAANGVTVSKALTTGENASLAGALTLSAGAALDIATGENALNLGSHALVLGTGMSVTESILTAITALAEEESLTLMQGVSSLNFSSVDAADYITGLDEGLFTLKLDDNKLVVTAGTAGPSDYYWHGGAGTWADEAWSTEGGSVVGDLPFVENRNAIFDGEGGTIAIGSAVVAGNVKVLDDYSFTGTDNLTIKKTLTVDNNATAVFDGMVNAAAIAVKSGSTLDLSAADMTSSNATDAGKLNALLSKTENEGTLIISGHHDAGNAVLLHVDTTVDSNVVVKDGIRLNSWTNKNRSLIVAEGGTLTVQDKALRVESTAQVNVAGGSLVAEAGIALGHGAEAGNPGTLAMSAGSIETTTIDLHDDSTQNKVQITGGKLTITGENAFTGTGNATSVAISNATLTNGEKDMAFNHASTLTDVTVEAKEDTTVTIGKTGATTTLVNALTTKGSTALAGTVSTTGMTALNNEGDLSVGGDISVAGLNNTGTMDVTGKLTLTNAPTAGGTVSAADAQLNENASFTKLTVTGTATVAEGKTLTVGDGSAIGTLAGDTLVVSGGTATITADTALSSLTNNGTLNVTNGLTLDSAVTTGGTISAGSLTLTDDGKLTGTALTTAAISFEALDKNAPLTLGTLSAASDSIAFTVADADLTALGNGATATLAVLNNAYGSGLTLNGSTADYTIGAFTYTISATGTSIVITSATSAQGWISTDGKWDSSSSWGEGEPGVSDTAYFLGGGTATVELDGNQSVGKVQVSVPTDGSGTQEYTFTGDKLTVAGDVQVDNGTLTVDNETSVGGDVVVNVLGTASSVAVGENGTLDIAGDLILNTTDKTVDNKGTLVIGGEADFTMTGEGSIGVGSEGDVTLQGATTVKDADVDGSLVVTGDLNVETINGTGSVNVGEHALTLTGDNGNGGDVTAATVTVSGTGNSLTSVTATDVTVSGAGNTLGDLEATTLTLNAIGTTVADMDVTTLVFNTLDDTDSAMTLTGSVTATDTVLVKLGEDVITMLCGTTGTQEYTLIDGTIDLGDFELDAAAVQALNAVSKTLKLQLGSLELVVADMGLGDLSWNVGSKKSEGGLDISDDGSKLVAADILDTIENVNVNGTKTIDLTDISGDVKVRNLTGNAASDLTIKGNGDDNVALLVNENQEVFAGKGMLQKLTLDNVAATAGREGDGTVLEIGELELTGGASLEASDLVVDSLNAADAAAGSVSGIIEVAGQGGIYKGAYAAPTTIALRDGSQLALVAGENLTVEGDGSDVSLLKSAAPVVDMAAVRLSNSKVKLGNMTGTTLLMANPSEMVESTITMGVTVESVESGNTGAVISAPSVSLYNSALVITQADPETTTMTLDPQIHKFVLAQVDGYEGDLGSVTLTGPAFNKYFTGAAIDENGEVTAVRNQHYFSETLLPQVTAPNAKAGLAMLDAALLELNPQGTAPEGALAGIMDALETHTAGDPQKLAASVAGSGLAGVSMAVAGDVERQLRAIRNRTTTMGVDQCVVNEDMPYVNAWINAEGDYAKLNAEGTKAGYNMSSWGGTVGFDVDCTPRFTCGMALTAMYGDFKSTDVDQVDGDINNYYVSAFARYSAHRWTHTGVATFGISDLTLNRTINYGMGSAKMKGDTNGTSFGAMYEVGYVMALDEDMTTCLQPIANITFRHIGVDGYTESGSDAALKVDDMDANIVTFGLGARLQSVVGENIYNRSSIFECRAMLKLDAGDTEGEAKTALKALNGHGRTVKGAEMGNVGFEIGAGLTVPVGQDAGSIFIDASAEFRGSYSSVNGTVGYRINF